MLGQYQWTLEAAVGLKLWALEETEFAMLRVGTNKMVPMSNRGKKTMNFG